MKDILEDIETRMFALDRALPDNSAARDLLEILHRSQVEIGKLREALLEFMRAKAWIGAASYDGIDERGRQLLDHADAQANIVLDCPTVGPPTLSPEGMIISPKATTPEVPENG